MPYPNEHSCRIRDPDDLEILGSEDREFEGKKYRVIYGRPKGSPDAAVVEQAYRYPINIWSEEEARAHCEEHKGSFHPATISIRPEVEDDRKEVFDSNRLSFSWTPSIIVKEKILYGVALVEGRTREDTFFTEEELKRSARTLIGKHVTIDHFDEEDSLELPSEYEEKYPGISDPYPVGYVIDSEYEDGKIEWIGICVNDRAYQLAKEGRYTGCSVWFDARSMEPTDGVAPKGVFFKDLSLLLESDPASEGTWVKAFQGHLSKILLPQRDKKFLYSKSLKRSCKCIGGRSGLQQPYSWNECVSDLVSRYGDEEKAKRICIAIKNKTITYALETGLVQSDEEAVDLLADKVDTDILFSYILDRLIERDVESEEESSQLLSKLKDLEVRIWSIESKLSAIHDLKIERKLKAQKELKGEGRGIIEYHEPELNEEEKSLAVKYKLRNMSLAEVVKEVS